MRVIFINVQSVRNKPGYIYKVGLLTFDCLHHAVESTHSVKEKFCKTQLVGSTPPIHLHDLDVRSDANLHYEWYTHKWTASVPP